jgi:hypothetical protein
VQIKHKLGGWFSSIARLPCEVNISLSYAEERAEWAGPTRVALCEPQFEGSCAETDSVRRELEAIDRDRWDEKFQVKQHCAAQEAGVQHRTK